MRFYAAENPQRASASRLPTVRHDRAPPRWSRVVCAPSLDPNLTLTLTLTLTLALVLTLTLTPTPPS